MTIYNALDLKSGKKAEYTKMGTLTQPIQFLPDSEKTEEWKAQCIDWLEWQGIRQLKRNAKKLLKNYKLAKGIIDKSDYIIEDNNDLSDLIESITQEDISALELKFYPIIPNVVNVLTNEFSKRSNRIMFKAVDETSYNEMVESKRKMIEDYLLFEANQKISLELTNMGIDLQSEEAAEALNPEKIKSLPEIEEFFRKDYRSLVEEWATHQYEVDVERFRMDELEEMAFRDMLITDREFWHFKMLEDDYDIEIWNPLLTFYHKSPDVRYISQGNWVGKIDMMTISDVVDKYGWMMNEEQLRSLEAIYPIKSAGYLVPGYQNDGTYYDPTRSHEWNTKMPSIAYRQFMSAYDSAYNNGDIIEQILNESEDSQDFGKSYMLRVTTVYWKSQRKIGHLTKITEEGELIQDIVTEDYKITDKPLYNTTIYKQKTKDNLIFGEHIDWIWINDVHGGIKIGPNRPAFWGMNNPGGVNPVYLGMNGGKPGRIPFQFKGDRSLYGCKLPVEGCVFGDRNTKSMSMVDLMKPSQVGYNLINNQIADIVIDELGTIVLFDQNGLPRHSMGEDWGKGNYQKAYMVMKNFQMLPLDTTITNTENPLSFQHYQVLNLEQTNRLLSRIQLATYFKNQAYEVIGITPQRLGQQLSQQDSAKGLEMAQNASYAQTEHYFIQHSDYLMPRVHQMRTDLAQYYHSKKPSVRLQYMTTKDEKVNFEINGTDLLTRDINIFCTTKVNTRAVLEQLKQLAVNNNTTGASIYDLGNIVKAESMSELNNVLKYIEEKQLRQNEAERQQQMEIERQRIEAEERQKQLEIQAQAERDDKMIRKDITVAEIRASGYGADNDINQNNQSDLMDSLNAIRDEQRYQDQMNLKRESELSKRNLDREKINLQKQELKTRKEIAEKQLQVARENKNKYDK